MGSRMRTRHALQVIAVRRRTAVVPAACLAALLCGTKAFAADMPQAYVVMEPPAVAEGVCGPLQEHAKLFERKNRRWVPTVPARTPYYYCVTGETLVPGEIPPPPEYCCP